LPPLPLGLLLAAKIAGMGLADPFLKTTRAKEHLECLREALKTFYESNPVSFVREDDLERQVHIIKAEFARIPDKRSTWIGSDHHRIASALPLGRR
jgi:hypothetical protein